MRPAPTLRRARSSTPSKTCGGRIGKHRCSRLCAMRKLLALVITGALAGILATAAFAATKSVKVGDNYYVRASGVPTVTVNKGDRLKFNFRGDDSHNAHGVGIKLGASCLEVRSSGSCRTNRLSKRGTFTIYCDVHGKSDQKMRVKVR